MNWMNTFSNGNKPTLTEIETFVATPLWQELTKHIEETYQVHPTIEYSKCSCAPGWNVKYKKSSRAVCTLYPAENVFTCLVSIGTKETDEAEMLLGACTQQVQDLYWQCNPFNGSRWLMIEVTSPEILTDVKALIGTRIKPKKKQQK